MVTAHVVSSVGWLGSVASFIALAVVGLKSPDTQAVSAVYVAAAVLGRDVIVPFSIATLATGLVVSLGTEWGLARHYWVLVKLLITIGATALLFLHLGPVNRLAVASADGTIGIADLVPVRSQVLFDASLGCAALLVATILSVYKPWGITPWARSASATTAHGGAAHRRATAVRPWGMYVLIAMASIVAMIVIVHLASGGLHRH